MQNKLRVYLAPFLHGMRYTSFGRHFTKVEKLEEVKHFFFILLFWLSLLTIDKSSKISYLWKFYCDFLPEWPKKLSIHTAVWIFIYSCFLINGWLIKLSGRNTIQLFNYTFLFEIVLPIFFSSAHVPFIKFEPLSVEIWTPWTLEEV